MTNKVYYDYIIRYDVEVECDGPLHIGASDGDVSKVLVNEVNNEVFIQATAIAGAFHNYVTDVADCEKERAEDLFGSRNTTDNENGKSKIIFTDGIFDKKTVNVELRPRVKINEDIGTVDTKAGSGQILDMEYVSAESRFAFSIYVYEQKGKEDYQDIVEECLAALNSGEVLLGGMNTIGCGKVKLLKVLKNVYDLKIGADRDNWLNNIVSNKQNRLSEIVENNTISNQFYTVSFTGEFHKGIMVKAKYIYIDKAMEIMGNSSQKEPDIMNIQNGKGRFIIPGSSLKGTFRSRMKSIAQYRNKTEIIKAGFENKSKVYFEDVLLENTENMTRTARIKINKMLGSVKNKNLYSEIAATGNGTVSIHISKKDCELSMALLGLVLYTVRDLAIGAMSLGGENNIGYGFTTVDHIMVCDGDKELVKIQNNKIEVGNEFVTKCLRTFNSYGRE